MLSTRTPQNLSRFRCEFREPQTFSDSRKHTRVLLGKMPFYFYPSISSQPDSWMTNRRTSMCCCWVTSLRRKPSKFVRNKWLWESLTALVVERLLGLTRVLLGLQLHRAPLQVRAHLVHSKRQQLSLPLLSTQWRCLAHQPAHNRTRISLRKNTPPSPPGST